MCSCVHMCIQQFRPRSVVCIVLYYVHTTWAMSKLLCSTIIGFVHLVQGFTRVVHNYFWITSSFRQRLSTMGKKTTKKNWKESCVSTGSIHGLHTRWLTSLSKHVASSQHDIFFHRNNSLGDPQEGFICTCSFENNLLSLKGKQSKWQIWNIFESGVNGTHWWV